MIEPRFADLFAQGAGVPLPVAEREIVLTYVLKILDNAGLLRALAFKGGTCLRKCVHGKETRFSADLDFTYRGAAPAEDVILDLVRALAKPAYGLEFAVDAKDFYTAEDGSSCGAVVGYAHSWNAARFKLEVSFRERPSLPPLNLPLRPQPYFKFLEFRPFAVSCLRFEELLAEKIRASFQRARSRDLYDLAKAAQKPLNAARVRALAVIKCWNVREAFDPETFLSRLRQLKYDWDDLRPFVRRNEKIDPGRLIAACESRYRFLRNLEEGEKRLIGDARRHRCPNLPRTLLEKANA